MKKQTTLRNLREQAGKSVKEVAGALGVAKPTFYNYERGLRKIGIEQPTPLSKIYDCTVEDIITAQLNSSQNAQEGNRR